MYELSAAELARRLRKGKADPVAVTEEVFARIAAASDHAIFTETLKPRAMAEARAVLNAKLATARSAVAVDPMRRSKGEANGRSSGAHHSARQAQILQLPSTSHGRCDGRGHCCGDGAGSVAAVPPTAHAAAAFSTGVVPPPPPTTPPADPAAAFATAAAIAAGAEGMGAELGAEMAARRALFTQHMQRVLARGS